MSAAKLRNPIEFSNNSSYTNQHAFDALSYCKNFFKWNESENILDVGCADGRVTKDVLYPFVKKHLGHLHGVDMSQEAIKVAMENNSTRNLTYFVLDITKEENGSRYENTYDHIFLFYVLHYLKPNKWPNILYKMTKSGGQICASVFLSPNFVTKVIKSQMEEKSTPWAKYFEKYECSFVDYSSKPEEYFKNLLIDEGFVVDTWDVLKFKATFINTEQLMGVLKGTDTFTERLPEDLHEAYWTDLVSKVKAYLEIDQNGHYVTQMNVLVFLATKPLTSI